MKIEEVIKIYDFLGNIGGWGFVGLCILLSVSLLSIFIPLKEKQVISTVMIVVIICIVNIGLFILYRQAQDKTGYLKAANFIKQDFVTTSYKQKSFSNITVPDTFIKQYKKDKEAFLYELIARFPDEFVLVPLSDLSKNRLNKIGIALTDVKAVEKIDKQIAEKASRTAHVMAVYMKSNNVNEIPVYSASNGTSLQTIDNDGFLIGEEFRKALIGRDNLLPIYYPDFSISGFTLPDKHKITSTKQ